MLTFVDLFCGGGFGAWGAVRGGGKALLGVDSWEIATNTYKINNPQADVICARIEDLDPYELSNDYRPDVLLTSPECTAHSIARGANPGSEKSRETALGIIPWLRAMQPEWLIIENVNRMKRWDRHDELITGIVSTGYEVSDLYLNSADFGTPQTRKRIFFICHRDGMLISRELLLRHRLDDGNKQMTAKDILGTEAKFQSTPLFKKGRAKATVERAERAIDKLGKDVPFLIVYYGSDYAGGWQTLDSPLRTVTTIDRFGLVTWHHGEPYLRMLQPEELTRAMGAEGLNLNVGNRREKIRLCGNGVCAPVLETIFRTLNKVDLT